MKNSRIALTLDTGVISPKCLDGFGELHRLCKFKRIIAAGAVVVKIKLRAISHFLGPGYDALASLV